MGTQDSVIVESPLPGGVATVVRFLFQSVPQWVQIAGFGAGLLVALVVLILLWRRRAAISTWVVGRPRGVKVGLGITAAIVLLTGLGAGKVSWDYMQHDNGFCTGCHVMEGAFTRFAQSEHDSLSCHDCHQQSIFASARQLYLWVAERPEEIGAHSPVPNAICESCHVTGEPEVWQRIAATAGHRTHLESDSSSLDSIMCVTCHGQEVHAFVPVDQTCGQSGCHEMADTEIAIGPMANQTSLHCVTCHQYTVEVPALATRDSAAGTLTPAFSQCTGCHEMQAVLGEFDAELDPHAGTCGACHNPHTQATAAAAGQTCADAGCHADWRTEPFHVGPTHRRIGEDCLTCHEPHRSRVDASDCQGCHESVLARPGVSEGVRNRLRRAAPFDTATALRRGVAEPLSRASPTAPPPAPRPGGPAPNGLGLYGVGWFGKPPGPAPRIVVQQLVTPPDSFAHSQHTELTCITCHTTTTGRGTLTFETPRGCQICHHQAPASLDCGICHAPGELTAPLATTVRLTISDSLTRRRNVELHHDDHTAAACVDCHAAPVTLATAPEAASCTACHDSHHEADRACAGCHTSVGVEDAHAPPADAHLGCDTCHDATTVARLMPDRSFCLTCHAEQRDHYPESTGACTLCHFLQRPDAFRAKLSSRGEGR